MFWEERIEALEAENQKLREEVEQIKRVGVDRFVTVKELADIMQCSRPTVYRMIKDGKIYASRKTGDPRIPMSQFYGDDPKLIQRRHDYLSHSGKARAQPKQELTLKEQIFGKEV